MKKHSLLLLAAPLFLITACKHNEKIPVIQEGHTIQIDPVPGNCPYLTKDTKGNIVVSWATAFNDSSSAFCYAVSADGGRSFGKRVVIPSSDNIAPHSENLPKIIFKPSGEIIALWGAANPNANNKYSGLVFYSQSFDEGTTWSQPKKLVNDTAGYDQRYYDVALLPNGEAAITWLDNRKTVDKEGSSLYFATTKGRNGFQEEKRIGQGCCECCRTDLFIDSKAGIHVLYRGIIKDSIRDMVHSVSGDGGKSFSVPRLISNDNWVIYGCPHTGPAMTENKEGLHFTWFTGGKNKGCFYTRSTDNGNSFNGHDRISALGSHPQVASFPNGKLIVVWDEPVPTGDKYYKRIAVQMRSATGKGEERGFITRDSFNAAYPVVETVDDHVSVIAYTMKKAGKDYVMCQRVDLK